MSIGKIIAGVVAVILLLLGVIYILASGDPQRGIQALIIGLILVAISIGLFWFALRRKPVAAGDENVTLKIDLPANVNMDTLKCKSCGGTLTPDNIKMVAGAPVVTCPYCHTTYQLTEEPKW